MAKPMHTGRAGCSSSPSSYSQQPNPQPKRRQRHSQRAPSSSSSSPGPSSSLLSLLAAIAASTTSANGSPAPLPFLCPSLAQNPVVENFEPRGLPARHLESDGTDIPDYPGVPRHIPDRYQLGDDGRWRLVEEYTLYGSTVCPSCKEPTNAVTSVDDQIQAPGSPISHSTPSPTPSDDIRLPPGWKAPTSVNKGHTTLIIVLSLVLAFVICFLIIGCLFWRKRRRKLKYNDVEARLRRRPTPVEDDREVMLEKEMRVKQKIWARATARWKANIRYSARQRRGKRIASTTRMSQAQHSTTSIDQPPDRSTTPTPFVLSRTVSQRSSMESMYATSSAIEATTDPPLPPEQEDSPSPSTSPPISSSRPRISSPPAYQQPLRISSEELSNTGTGQLAITSISSQYHFCSRCNSYHSSDTSCGSDNCPPALHAHVATDDKNLLARLAQLASSPPSENVLASEAEPSIPEVSAPAWEDEELDDFREPYPDVRSHNSSSNHRLRAPSPAPLFPSPPSKGKMSGPNFYDYPYTFDDISMDPEVGPAAPPFEAGPSAPPANDIDLMPSAPPLMEEDTYCLKTHASAPILGWEPAASPLPLEDTDQVEMGTHDQEDMMPTNHLRQPDTSVPTMDTLPPSVQGPVASDGTPPSYHP